MMVDEYWIPTKFCEQFIFDMFGTYQEIYHKNVSSWTHFLDTLTPAKSSVKVQSRKLIGTKYKLACSTDYIYINCAKVPQILWKCRVGFFFHKVFTSHLINLQEIDLAKIILFSFAYNIKLPKHEYAHVYIIFLFKLASFSQPDKFSGKLISQWLVLLIRLLWWIKKEKYKLKKKYQWQKSAIYHTSELDRFEIKNDSFFSRFSATKNHSCGF